MWKIELTKENKDNTIYTLICKKKRMFILRIFLLFIATISLVCGVKFIFDARPIVKKYFSFGDKNEAALGLKLFGFLLMILGGILLYFNY